MNEDINIIVEPTGTIKTGDAVLLTANISKELKWKTACYRWKQVSGPSIHLIDNRCKVCYFHAPFTKENTEVEIEVSATNGTDTLTLKISISISK